MPIVIKSASLRDIRFPTSRHLDGSDAMNPDPDYSAAYVILETDHPKNLAGHGFGFTIGRGNEIVVAAIRALIPMIIGRTLESITATASNEAWHKPAACRSSSAPLLARRLGDADQMLMQGSAGMGQRDGARLARRPPRAARSCGPPAAPPGTGSG